MEEVIRIIADTNITWGGAMVIIAFILRPVLLAYIDLSKTRIESTVKVEQDRIDAEKDQTKVLGALKEELIISRGMYKQMLSGVTAIPDAIGFTNLKVENVHNDLKSIPAEVWRLGDPKLDILKTEFMRYIDSLQEVIEDRIDPNAVNAREAIRLEFASIADQLDQIAKTVAMFKPKTEPDPPSPKPPKSATPKLDRAA